MMVWVEQKPLFWLSDGPSPPSIIFSFTLQYLTDTWLMSRMARAFCLQYLLASFKEFDKSC